MCVNSVTLSLLEVEQFPPLEGGAGLAHSFLTEEWGWWNVCDSQPRTFTSLTFHAGCSLSSLALGQEALVIHCFMAESPWLGTEGSWDHPGRKSGLCQQPSEWAMCQQVLQPSQPSDHAALADKWLLPWETPEPEALRATPPGFLTLGLGENTHLLFLAAMFRVIC